MQLRPNLDAKAKEGKIVEGVSLCKFLIQRENMSAAWFIEQCFSPSCSLSGSFFSALAEVLQSFDSETFGAISDLPSLESEAYYFFFPCRVRPSHL